MGKKSTLSFGWFIVGFSFVTLALVYGAWFAGIPYDQVGSYLPVFIVMIVGAFFLASVSGGQVLGRSEQCQGKGSNPDNDWNLFANKLIDQVNIQKKISSFPIFPWFA